MIHKQGKAELERGRDREQRAEGGVAVEGPKSHYLAGRVAGLLCIKRRSGMTFRSNLSSSTIPPVLQILLLLELTILCEQPSQCGSGRMLQIQNLPSFLSTCRKYATLLC